MTTELEGLNLVRAVIEQVRAKGFKATFAERATKVAIRDVEPEPVAAEVLEAARLDGGVPLSPCLKEWLAFDGSLFGWFEPGGIIRGEKLGTLATEQLEVDRFDVFERTLPRRCYMLPFSNSEYLHFIYPSKPDSIGELPVLSAESENDQVLVTHPGIDTYLGHHAGLLEKDWRKRLRPRFVEHHQQTLGGKQGLELGEDGYVPDAPEPDKDPLPPGIQKMDAKTYMMTGDGPVPPGFRVVREGQNPFTKQPLRFLTKG